MSSLEAIVSTTFFHILSCVLSGEEPDKDLLKSLSEDNWSDLYSLAGSQGVTAVIFDKMKTLSELPGLSKTLALKWMSKAMSIEQLQRAKRDRSVLFAGLMRENALNVMVLKGIAFSTYYPNPLHREFGDLDCFLFSYGADGVISLDGCYEKGNCLAESAGGVVERNHYKHSHIHFGIEIENHQFCLPVRGSKAKKSLERHLRSLIVAKPPQQIGRTNLYNPCADFNALFLISHAMTHFLYEKINFRHIMDWALFLKTERDNIDWSEFWKWCDNMHYTVFVRCLNHICDKYLGTDYTSLNDFLPNTYSIRKIRKQGNGKNSENADNSDNPKNVGNIENAENIGKIRKQGNVKNSENADNSVNNISERILDDIFYGESLYNKGYSIMRAHFEIIRRFFTSHWKYSDVYRQSALQNLFCLVWGFLFEKTPKIDEANLG